MLLHMLYGLPGSEGVRYDDPILKSYIQKVAVRNLLLRVGCYTLYDYLQIHQLRWVVLFTNKLPPVNIYFDLF